MTSAHPTPRPLTRLAGVAFCVSLALGWSFGVPGLAASGAIARHFDHPAGYAGIWAAGLLFALVAAAALSRSPAGGGCYAAVRAGLGDYAGFVAGWTEWIAICGATAGAALLAGEFAVGLVPAARAAEVVALALIAAFTAIVWAGRRAGLALQIATAVLALVGVIAFAGAAFWLGSRSPADASIISAEREGPMFPDFVIAMQFAAIALAGWAAPLYAGEGSTRRARLGWALAAAAAAAGVVHATMGAAMLHVVSLPTIAGNKLALETSAARLFGSASYDGVRTLLIVLLASGASAGLLMAPRVLQAMAADGLFWRGAVSEAAILFTGGAVAALVVTATFTHVMSALAVLLLSVQLLAFVAAMVESRGWDRTKSAAAVAALLTAGMLAGIFVMRPARALPLLLMVAALPVCWMIRRRGAHQRASLAMKSGSGSRID